LKKKILAFSIEIDASDEKEKSGIILVFQSSYHLSFLMTVQKNHSSMAVYGQAFCGIGLISPPRTSTEVNTNTPVAL
jgi:hypothetical protein